MHAFARPAVGFALLVGAASPFVLSSHRAAPPVLSTVPVNETFANSLTTLKVTAAAPIQNTRPIVIQRGTGIDGRLRSAPAQNMAIAANPFEDV